MKAMSAALNPTRAGLVALLALAVASCDSNAAFGLPEEEDQLETTVAGTVVDASSGALVEGAVVQIVSLSPQPSQQTDADGRYSFSVALEADSELTITAGKSGYIEDSISVTARPESDVYVSDLRLAPVAADPGNPGSTPATGPGPKSIVLATISDEAILVKESGGRETADITFEVRDSLGLPLDGDNPVDVAFSFGAHPGGGETLYSTSAKTDETGRATTSLHSGTVAGVVQVVAEVTHNGTVIRSRPASIAIHGGLPDRDHFGVGPFEHNMPFVKLGYSDAVTAIVGDKYGNIATPGTAVYFSTTGGIIEGSAQTNAKGAATVELIANNPFPVHPEYGPGYAVVTASTANEHDETIQTQALVLMSGNAQISGVSPASFSIPNGGAQTISFTVSDQHGNPLTGGTTIKVEAGDGVKLSGHTDVELADALFGGQGITDFSFTVADADADNEEPVSVTITISVEGKNGVTGTTLSGSAS